MGGQIMNLFVIMAAGVMIAELVAKKDETTALFQDVSKFWQIGVNGMLGKPTDPAAGP
jgi:hypothetical protein